MIATYTIDTPMLHDAREQAVSMAKAQGYEGVRVLSMNRVGTGTQWQVKMQLFR